jgi:hypothetical protein
VAGPCPKCGAPTLPVDEPLPAPAISPPLPPKPPSDSREARAAAQPVRPEEVASPGPPRRRRILAAAWLILPVGIVVAVVAALIVPARRTANPQAQSARSGTSVENATRGPGQTGHQPAYLPRTLAYIAPTRGVHGPLRLFMTSGPLPGHLVEVPEIGQPVSVEFSPDGGHQAVLDGAGRMIVLPERRVIPGSVRDFAFSPGAELVAVCSGAWPPRISIFPLGQSYGQRGPSFPGCDPMWSEDGTYLAYRVPADPSPDAPHLYRQRSIEVLNTRLRLTFSVAGSWPVAWATAPGFAIRPLAVTDGRSVDLVDPRGGGRRTLVYGETLVSLASGRPLGRITLLAWSPDGARLAIGFGPSWAGFTAVIDVELRTGQGAFLQDTYGIHSFTWSDNDDLLVGISGPGRGRTVLIRGAGQPDPSLVAWEASWSGASAGWFLASQPNGWAVMDTANAGARLVPQSQTWVFARWCCPPVPVITPAPDPGP